MCVSYYLDYLEPRMTHEPISTICINRFCPVQGKTCIFRNAVVLRTQFYPFSICMCYLSGTSVILCANRSFIITSYLSDLRTQPVARASQQQKNSKTNKLHIHWSESFYAIFACRKTIMIGKTVFLWICVECQRNIPCAWYCCASFSNCAIIICK